MAMGGLWADPPHLLRIQSTAILRRQMPLPTEALHKASLFLEQAALPEGRLRVGHQCKASHLPAMLLQRKATRGQAFLPLVMAMENPVHRLNNKLTWINHAHLLSASLQRTQTILLVIVRIPKIRNVLRLYHCFVVPTVCESHVRVTLFRDSLFHPS